eukprot:TRINITY_DN22704_c0_g1_i6.p1 TRINITY_DN22704_c0_g1~~TRINITY_DN22704_c0_g1_i6.p1  ORF type:complete len:306 (-),score=64.75 TRINITY_DN22704_c0_g1_i6:500-1417(-)
MLCAAASDCTMHWWSLSSSKRCAVLRGHTQPVVSMLVHKAVLITCSPEPMVKMWDTQTTACIATLSMSQLDALVPKLLLHEDTLFMLCSNGFCRSVHIPDMLVGVRVEAFWPDDGKWYDGMIRGYNRDSDLHHIVYTDGDAEDLAVPSQDVRFSRKQGIGGCQSRLVLEKETSEEPSLEAEQEESPKRRCVLLPDSKDGDWLPEGWSMQERVRVKGMGGQVRRDRVYISPVGKVFRSKVEVERFLAPEQRPDTKQQQLHINEECDISALTALEVLMDLHAIPEAARDDLLAWRRTIFEEAVGTDE